MKKTSIILCSILLIGLFGTIASAESITDPSGDVAHWNYTETTWGWNYNVGNKPDVDITELKYTLNENELTLELVVDGTIQTSELYAYSAWFNTSDSMYMFSWSNGEGMGIAMNTDGGFNMSTAEPVATDNSLSVTFDMIGGSAMPDNYWGYAWHYSELNNAATSEWWGDWIPNDESPFYGDDTGDSGEEDSGDGDSDDTDGDGDTGDSDGTDSSGDTSSGTPGFEFIAFFAAIIASILITKKRK